MKSEWPQYSLSKVCKLVVDCPHASPKWTNDGFIVLRNHNIKNGRLDLSAQSYTNLENYIGRIKRAKPQAGDLVITREAPMGEVCLIPEGLICCLGQRQVLLRPDPIIINSRYLLYTLQSPYLQNQISWNEGTGSTVSNLRIPVLEELKIPTPNLAVQKEVAETLGALDDRINLLRETNTTLEAIAQALFKSWFIDFDPVHAKIQGQAPQGMDEATAALFPDSFEESELGPIPKGWETVTFRSSINVIGGGTPKTSTSEFWNGDIPWFSVVDAPVVSDVFVVNTEKKITQAGLNGSSTKLLAEGTTIISARGTVGRLALTGCPMAMNQSCYGLRGKADDQFFTFYSTKRLVEQLKQRAHGSVFDTITQETFEGVDVCYPKVNLIYSFEQFVEPLMKRIKNNLIKVNTLNTIRNTLLPKLISGEITLTQISI